MNIFEENNAVVRLCPIISYKATVTKASWYWHQNIQINGTEQKVQGLSEIYIYTNLVYVIICISCQQKNDGLVVEWCWDNWLAIQRKQIKVNPLFKLYTEFKFSKIKDINVNMKTIKIFRRVIGKYLADLWMGRPLLCEWHQRKKL